MRLWHKDLISVLPRQQLLSQWRDLCCIARNIDVNDTPNHILVNKILLYSPQEFFLYSWTITNEMKRHGYIISTKSMKQFNDHFNSKEFKSSFHHCTGCVTGIYTQWMNDRYLRQCLYNLQEIYDCGGITEEEWKLIESKFGKFSE